MKRDTTQFVIVILTCLATVSLALSTWRLSSSTKKLVERNIEEFEVTNRPYVQILPYKTEFKLEENEITVYFKNWGKSFANNMLVDYGFEGLGLSLEWTGRIKYYSIAPGEIISCPIAVSSQQKDFTGSKNETTKKIEPSLLAEKGAMGLILRWTYKWQNKTCPQNPEEAIASLLCIVDEKTKTPKIHYYKSLDIVELIDKMYKEQLAKLLGIVYVDMPKEYLLEVVELLPQKSYRRTDSNEWITYLNWTTKEPDDLVTFYIVDGKLKRWEEE